MTERWGRALQRLAASIRTRLLVTIVVVLAIAVGGTALVTRQVLLSQVDARIQDHLTQEVEELRIFAEGGVDPRTGEPFGTDAPRMLTVFLERSIPAEGEVMITYVDGEPFRRTVQRVDHRVDADPELTRRWGSTTTSDRGVVDTPAGPFEYLAVPVTSEGGTSAVFLVGQFREVVAAEVAETVRVTAWVGLASLVAGLVVAIALARRILTPLDRVTRTARDLTESDLSRRLEVAGHDEVSELATTFNDMLDRLQAAFALQRQFVDDAGHELRTPITVIRGHLELLDHEDAEDREATVELVLDELDRMHRIVEDLLVLARAEQHDFVTPGPVDLDELTVSIQRKAAAISSAHPVGLDTVATGRVDADQQRLTQAMMQLADNATRHTPAGTPIAIGSAIEDQQARLWVRDEGPGVPEGDQARIFERFTRGSSGPRRSDGAGLGLAIVRAIAEAHGGTVDLDSSPERGTTFTLRLPLAPGASGGEDPADHEAGTPQGPPPTAELPTTDQDVDATRPISLPETRP